MLWQLWRQARKACRRLAYRVWAWSQPRRRLTLAAFLVRCHGRGSAQQQLPWNDIVRRDPCSYCGSYNDPTVEHVVPIGGTQRQRLGTWRGPWTNKVGACRPCNSRRGRTPLMLFLIREHHRRVHNRPGFATKKRPTSRKDRTAPTPPIGKLGEFARVTVVNR